MRSSFHQLPFDTEHLANSLLEYYELIYEKEEHSSKDLSVVTQWGKAKRAHSAHSAKIVRACVARAQQQFLPLARIMRAIKLGARESSALGEAPKSG